MKMAQVCRVCLEKGTELVSLGVGNDSLGKKVTVCVPEVNITLISNPLICPRCLSMLEAAYKFREKCLLTEKRIIKFFKDLYLKSIGRLAERGDRYSKINFEGATDISVDLNEYLSLSILEGLAKTTESEDHSRPELTEANEFQGHTLWKATEQSESQGHGSPQVPDTLQMRDCYVLLSRCAGVKEEDVKTEVAIEDANEAFSVQDRIRVTDINTTQISNVKLECNSHYARKLNGNCFVCCSVCQNEVHIFAYKGHKRKHVKDMRRKNLVRARAFKMMKQATKGSIKQESVPKAVKQELIDSQIETMHSESCKFNEGTTEDEIHSCVTEPLTVDVTNPNICKRRRGRPPSKKKFIDPLVMAKGEVIHPSYGRKRKSNMQPKSVQTNATKKVPFDQNPGTNIQVEISNSLSTHVKKTGTFHHVTGSDMLNALQSKKSGRRKSSTEAISEQANVFRAQTTKLYKDEEIFVVDPEIMIDDCSGVAKEVHKHVVGCDVTNVCEICNVEFGDLLNWRRHLREHILSF